MNEDDVTIEPEEGSEQETIKKLSEKLKTTLIEKQEYLPGWQKD